MLTLSTLICLAGLLAFAGAFWKADQARRDEGRMAGYIASLKATATAHRTRAIDLEQVVRAHEQLLASQDRLLEGQASHLRSLDPHYAG